VLHIIFKRSQGLGAEERPAVLCAIQGWFVGLLGGRHIALELHAPNNLCTPPRYVCEVHNFIGCVNSSHKASLSRKLASAGRSISSAFEHAAEHFSEGVRNGRDVRGNDAFGISNYVWPIHTTGWSTSRTHAILAHRHRTIWIKSIREAPKMMNT